MAPPPAARAPAAPNSALQSYSGDPEDDAPTRLYSHPGSSPPPAMQPQGPRTNPRNDRPPAPAVEPAYGGFQQRGAPRKKLYIAGGLLGVLVASVALFFGGSKTGSLTITVAGPGGRALDDVTVFVDDKQQCDKSPCRISEIAAGVHLIRATAKGYQSTADQAVSVQAGGQSSENVSLVPAGAGTGVRVSALGSGLKLYVDGEEIGELPQTAKNLTPGEHTLRVAGNDRYEPYEERVNLDDNEMRTLGPLKLRVLKGLATFKPGAGADGARVLLDGRLVPQLPATIEVPAGKQLTLLASKSGYSTYRRTVTFEDGVAEKTFEITMVEGTDDAPSAGDTTEDVALERAAPSQRKQSPAAPKSTSPKVAAVAPPAAPSSAKGKATINMNSIPVSNVILNGRPLGATPKLGVQVAPGPQTVVFVHPTMGRKVMSANVGAGESKTFMARLQ